MACDYSAKDFTELATIQVKTEIADGFGGYSKSWAKLVDYWCLVESETGNESSLDGRIEDQKSIDLIGRYDSSITPKNRILFDGIYYNIISVEDIRRQNKFLKINAVSREDGQ